MSNFPNKSSCLPGEQLQIKAKCMHPSGTFEKFRKEDVEQSIPERFEQQVLKNPDRLAVKTMNSQFSYKELNKAANRMAHSILARSGKNEEPVALLLPNEPPAIAAMLGVLKAGKIHVYMDPSDPYSRLTHILQDSQARLIVTNSEKISLASELAEASHQLINIDEQGTSFSTENPNLTISPDRLSFIIYTSGSTGQPKGVIQNHRNMLHMVRNFTNALYICAEDRQIYFTSPGGIGALWFIFHSLLNGAAVFPFNIKKEGMGKLAEWLVQEEITIFSALAILRRFARTLTGEENFSKIRLVLFGGDRVYRSDFELYRKYFSPKTILAVGFGTTETGRLTRYFADKETEITDSVMPVGYAVNDMEVLLLDDNGKEVGFDRIGEITVKSRYLSPGYWRKPDLTQTAFLTGPEGGQGERVYRTGDLGRMLADNCIYHLGRKDFQVKIRGYRIELAEVELALLELENIKEAVVVVKEGKLEEQRLIAYLVCATPPGPSITILRRLLSQKLPDYMIPSSFVKLKALPLNPNGKVDRQSLPEPSTDRPDIESLFVPPRDELEIRLTKIWEQLLNIKSIGVKDSFFDLGGQSLQALHLFVQIKDFTHKSLPLSTLIKAPTIEKLANILRQKDWKPNWSCLVEIQSGDSKPPFFCVHGAGGNVLIYRDLARYLGPDQPVYGLQSKGLNGEQPFHTRIEDMAAHYIEEIQAAHPKGPYFLGGYCLGGIVALEMAQQLYVKGQKVDLLVLFETYNLSNLRTLSFLDRPYYYLQKIYFHLRNFLLLESKQKVTFVKEKARVVKSRRKVWYGLILSQFGQKFSIGNEQYLNLSKLWEINDRASFNYVPKVYPGRITQFRPVKEYASHDRPQMGWEKLASGGVEIHKLPVYPAGMLVEPFVQILGNKVKECIHRAIENEANVNNVVL